MQKSTRKTFLTRMAMILLFAMVGMVASAQTFVVVDKNGNRVTYDVSKLQKVTFKEDPPAFTVHEVTEQAKHDDATG